MFVCCSTVRVVINDQVVVDRQLPGAVIRDKCTDKVGLNFILT